MTVEDRPPEPIGRDVSTSEVAASSATTPARIGSSAAIVLGLLALLLVVNVATFPAVEAGLDQQYRALDPYETNDVLDVHAQRGDTSGDMYALPWTLGEVAPEAVLIVPLDIMRPDLTFAARLDGFSQLAELRSVDVGEEWRDWVDEDAIMANVVAERPASSLPAWIIALDPAGDHDEFVYVRLDTDDGGVVDAIVESGLLVGGPA